MDAHDGTMIVLFILICLIKGQIQLYNSKFEYQNQKLLLKLNFILFVHESTTLMNLLDFNIFDQYLYI
jgi:hypothetical protein